MGAIKRIFLTIVCVLYTLPTPTGQAKPDELPNQLDFRPFRAYRPDASMARLVSSPPYHSLSRQEATLLAQTNPFSFVHIDRPEIQFITQHKTRSGTTTGIMAKKNLEDFIEDRLLIRDAAPCFYLYCQEQNTTSLYGIIGEIAVKNYRTGLIKPHEKTIPKKEEFITQLTHVENAQIKPIVLTYKSNQVLNNIMFTQAQEKPGLDFISEDGIRHRLWLMKEKPVIQEIRKLVRALPCLYIADGHHRAAAACHIQQWQHKKRKSHNRHQLNSHHYDYYLAALFPDDQVDLLGYHRVIKKLPTVTDQKIFDLLAQHFIITPVASAEQAQPQRLHTYGMRLSNQWYALTAQPHLIKEALQNSVSNLDISLLNKWAITPLLKNNSQHKNNLKFIEGTLSPTQVNQCCNAQQWRLCFLIHPVSMNQLMSVVDEGKLMPPKSTWFEPKMRSGLIVRMLEN